MKRIFTFYFLICAVPVWAGSFFESPIRFFEETRPVSAVDDNDKDISLRNTTADNFWTEPIAMPDGRITAYTPPKPALDFVENPSEETVKAYFEWNQARIKKIESAQRFLNEYLRRRELEEKKELPVIREKPLLVFFLLNGCAMCKQEVPVIEELFLRSDMEIKVFGKGFPSEGLKQFPFPVENDRGESIVFGVTSYPSVYGIKRTGEKFNLAGTRNVQEILEQAL